MSKFEEDKKGDYSEEGSFTHDGVEYDIKKAFNIAKDKNKRSFKVKDLEWVLKHDTPDKTRKDKADLSAPIMVAKDKKGRLTTVDGLHRLAKAVELKKSSIKGVFLSDKDLEECKISLDEKKRKKKKAGSESSKESSLRDWFKRKGAKGKKGGWVDCNAPDGKGGYKSCGRGSGEKRKKYPACRPTPSACKERGRGKSWGKKGSKKKRNESMKLISKQLKEMIDEELKAVLSENSTEEIAKLEQLWQNEENWGQVHMFVMALEDPDIDRWHQKKIAKLQNMLDNKLKELIILKKDRRKKQLKHQRAMEKERASYRTTARYDGLSGVRFWQEYSDAERLVGSTQKMIDSLRKKIRIAKGLPASGGQDLQEKKRNEPVNLTKEDLSKIISEELEVLLMEKEQTYNQYQNFF